MLFIKIVTILILIDGFLQLKVQENYNQYNSCHNPYFNRWFSAIYMKNVLVNTDVCHNPYFNRWFSAIQNQRLIEKDQLKGHNPYFNRWFSAIVDEDGFPMVGVSHNPYFNRWFSAIAAKISQNFTFLCKKLVFSDSFCELYFTQPLYINYCTNYLNTFLLKLAKIKAIINII